jgi:hypothetical protein
MAGVIARADMPDLLVQGFKTVVGLEYKEHPLEWSRAFKQYDSDKAYERDAMITGLGNATVKQEGAQTQLDSMSEAWIASYQNIAIALGFTVTHEAWRDNLYMDIISKGNKELARSFRNTEEIMAASILNNAFNSGYVGGDGSPLLSTAHQTKSGQYLQNCLATAADLSEAAIEDLAILIDTAKNDRGIPVQLDVDTLAIPPQLRFVAERLLKSTNRPGTADNDINAINKTGVVKGGYHVMRRLTSASNWFLTTDCLDGLKMFNREAFMSRSWEDEATLNMHVTGYRRLSFGWTNPRGCYGSGS